MKISLEDALELHKAIAETRDRTTVQGARDVLVTVAQRNRTKLRWSGWWTILPEEWHFENRIQVAALVAVGMLRWDGECGLKLTALGREYMHGKGCCS